MWIHPQGFNIFRVVSPSKFPRLLSADHLTPLLHTFFRYTLRLGFLGTIPRALLPPSLFRFLFYGPPAAATILTPRLRLFPSAAKLLCHQATRVTFAKMAYESSDDDVPLSRTNGHGKSDLRVPSPLPQTCSPPYFVLLDRDTQREAMQGDVSYTTLQPLPWPDWCITVWGLVRRARDTDNAYYSLGRQNIQGRRPCHGQIHLQGSTRPHWYLYPKWTRDRRDGCRLALKRSPEAQIPKLDGSGSQLQGRIRK